MEYTKLKAIKIRVQYMYVVHVPRNCALYCTVHYYTCTVYEYMYSTVPVHSVLYNVQLLYQYVSTVFSSIT